MAGEKHLLLTIIGGYRSADLVAESWVSTLRLALVFGTVDPAGTLPSNWNPVATTINRTESDWTITGNWSISAGLAADFDPGDYLNDQAAPAVATWAARSGASDIVRVDALKLSPIGAPTGHLVPAAPYTSGTPCTLTWTAPGPQGPESNNMEPLQLAMVASHRTSQPGRRGRGRMFLPGLVETTMTRYGQLNSTQTLGWANAQATLLEGLALTLTTPTALQVRPIVTGKPFVNYGVIDNVIVDSVPDTQRRRRKSVVPLTTSAVAPSY